MTESRLKIGKGEDLAPEEAIIAVVYSVPSEDSFLPAVQLLVPDRPLLYEDFEGLLMALGYSIEQIEKILDRIGSDDFDEDYDD